MEGGIPVNQLLFAKQVEIISLLTEGMSINAISRLTGVHRDTIMRLSLRVGQACDRLHDATMQNLQVPFIEIDETWSFIQKKQQRVQEHHPPEQGDCYLWLAIDPMTKVVLSYLLGKRTAENAKALLADVRRRVLNRPQITTDGYTAYVDAVEEAFGTEVHYASVTKEAGFLKQTHQGQPDLARANTTFIERCNLTVRMHLRRHARRTNAHSKTLEGHQAAIALHFAFYHWCRIHETLRVTPAMELGLTNHVWSVGELIETAQESPAPDPLPAVARRPPRLRVIQGGRGQTAS